MHIYIYIYILYCIWWHIRYAFNFEIIPCHNYTASQTLHGKNHQLNFKAASYESCKGVKLCVFYALKCDSTNGYSMSQVHYL